MSNAAVDGTDWHVEAVPTRDLNLVEGQAYTLTFRARADAPPAPARLPLRPRTLRVSSYAHAADWHSIGMDQTLPLTEKWQTFRTRFIATGVLPGDNRAPQFLLGQSVGVVWLADVTLKAEKKTQGEQRSPR